MFCPQRDRDLNSRKPLLSHLPSAAEEIVNILSPQCERIEYYRVLGTRNERERSISRWQYQKSCTEKERIKSRHRFLQFSSRLYLFSSHHYQSTCPIKFILEILVRGHLPLLQPFYFCFYFFTPSVCLIKCHIHGTENIKERLKVNFIFLLLPGHIRSTRREEVKPPRESHTFPLIPFVVAAAPSP